VVILVSMRLIPELPAHKASADFLAVDSNGGYDGPRPTSRSPPCPRASRRCGHGGIDRQPGSTAGLLQVSAQQARWTLESKSLGEIPLDYGFTQPSYWRSANANSVLPAATAMNCLPPTE
jgi:hypothetical protein